MHERAFATEVITDGLAITPEHHTLIFGESVALLVWVSSKRIATRSFLRSLLLLLLLLLFQVPHVVGTECYGEGSSQFPESNLFMAVGDGLWDLGAACGREYELRCISNAQSGPGPCKPGASTIRVKVVNYALSVESSAAAPRQSVTGVDLVLSQPAFEVIANPYVDSIAVE